MWRLATSRNNLRRKIEMNCDFNKQCIIIFKEKF